MYCLICFFLEPNGIELLLRDEWQTRRRRRKKVSILQRFPRYCRQTEQLKHTQNHCVALALWICKSINTRIQKIYTFNLSLKLAKMIDPYKKTLLQLLLSCQLIEVTCS